MDNNPQAKALVTKYHQGTATPEERLLVEQWFLIDLENSKAVPSAEEWKKADKKIRAGLSEHIGLGLKDNAGSSLLLPDSAGYNPASSLRLPDSAGYCVSAPDSASYDVSVPDNAGSNFSAPDNAGSTKPDRPAKLWPLGLSRTGLGIAVAAAVAVITLGVWLYYTPRHPDAGQDPGSAQYANDVAPGKNTATLTLANGKTIVLSDAKTGVVIDASQIMYSDNTVISTERSDERSLNNTSGKDLSHSFEMTSVSTPRGGTYQVTLPDGTHVWLNSESKISFPSQFNRKERRIMMEGEAYFEVAKAYSSSRVSAATRTLVPFIVETKRQTIEVLGTHFNVSAYADEKEMMTTLLEGKVKVKGEGNTITLDPGEQAYSGSDGIRGLKIDDPAAVIAWKEGDIVLDADIKTIMRQLTRWYNVEVVYEGQVSNQEFGGTISRTKNISEVLNVLQSTGRVKFKIEGRRVTVMP